MQRFDPFRALDERARDADLSAHRAMLAERDGGLDPDRRRLTGRESFFIRLDSHTLRWMGTLDRPCFVRNLKDDPAPVEDARVAWLLTVAKANEAEHYGVGLELHRFAAKGAARIDEHLLLVALQDRDHARILERACRVFGIQLHARRPRLAARLAARAINRLPQSLRMPLILSAEVVGAVLFGILLERCDLFSEQPEVEQRLRLLIGEILVDETGHVAFCRARVRPALLPVSRALAPRLAAHVLRRIPELAMLAGGRAEVLRRVRESLPVPDPVRWIECGAPAS